MTAALNLLVPQIEAVGQQNAVSSSPQDAPAVMAAKDMGKKFGEFTSDSVAMVVLVGDQPLGDAAHRYYDTLVDELQKDTVHVQHIQNFWGDPITAAGAQSADGKAAYVQLNLAGDQGSTLGNASVEAVRDIVDHTQAPPGVRAYVTGPAPLTTDTALAGDKSMVTMMAVTMVVITIMLLIVYRSISTVLLILAMVGIEMGAARGVVALLGHAKLLDFSTFSVSLLTALAIAAGTDYAIFLIGRYQEARQSGEDPRDGVLQRIPRRGTRHPGVGADHRRSGAVPATDPADLLQVVGPSGGHRGGRRRRRRAHGGTGHPRRGEPVRPVGAETGDEDPRMASHRHRDGPLARARSSPSQSPSPSWASWPCRGTRPATRTATTFPSTVPSNEGYNAAEKHFSAARLNPDIMMVESDHDMRNSGDMIVLDRIAKSAVPDSRNRHGAEHHPAVGLTDRPQLHPVSGRHAIGADHPEPPVPEDPDRRHATRWRPTSAP